QGRAFRLRRRRLERRQAAPPRSEDDRPHGRDLVHAHPGRLRAGPAGDRDHDVPQARGETMKKQPFQNLVVDHMTFLVEPRFYNVAYVLFRVVFGVPLEDVIYEKRTTWEGEKEESSMTFASRIGRHEGKKELDSTII